MLRSFNIALKINQKAFKTALKSTARGVFIFTE